MSRIVIKVGSNVLTRADGHPDVTNLSSIVDQIAVLRNIGHEIVLVSSGAVACGRGAIQPSAKLDSVGSRQLFASIGQIHLINLYNSLFASYGIVVGQVLTQKENFSSRSAYLNQCHCMLTMLEAGVIPIVNENDTVSLTELMFTDNDELSGLVATMLGADRLIILSNVDGIYTGAPSDPESTLIPKIKPGDNPGDYVVATKSAFGRGGMATKCSIARKVADEGVTVIIAKGTRPNVLVDLMTAPDTVPHTEFVAAQNPLSSIKRWLAHSDSFAKGSVTVNANAAAALEGPGAVSLLPVGVTEVAGDWDEGDIITVLNPEGQRIAVGRASTDSNTARESIGLHNQAPLIHYDYLCID